MLGLDQSKLETSKGENLFRTGDVVAGLRPEQEDHHWMVVGLDSVLRHTYYLSH